MAGSEKAPQAQWLIDTHGVIEALTTKSNSLRDAVIGAIEGGEMLILKRVSDEISASYPELWDDFKAIKKRKYVQITVPVIMTASTMAETYGSSLLGGVPTKEHFQAVACARREKCTLVSSAKALSDCQSIAKKCGLPGTSVVSVSAFAALN